MPSLSTVVHELSRLVDDSEDTGERRTREFEVTHEPETATGVDLSTRNGAIDVHPVDGDALTVHATARSRHVDDDLDAVAVAVEETEDVVVVSVDVPESNRGTRVDLDVGVPTALALDAVASRNGAIEVRDVHGDAHVETRNGMVTVERVDGRVDAVTRNGALAVRDTAVRDARSRNGSIDLVLSTVGADTAVESTNGSISVAVPGDTDAVFALSTKTGTAAVEGLTCLVDEDSRRNVVGELGAGGPQLDARTKNGTVTLRAR